jgi:ribosomal protein S18 acetylase RimI-like enzyme
VIDSEKQIEGVARLDPNREYAQSVTLRAATPADRSFLLTVFAGTRTDELAALVWDPAQSQAFIQMQFSAQQQNYSACYPAAENSIILLGERPIGRMLVERTEQAIELVDIALLAEHRSNGIGSFLIRGLLDEAGASQKSVRLSVYKLNPAVRLYERLGFSLTAEDALYFEMTWAPAES